MGPIAPKDPVKKRDFFYIMLEKQISAAPAENGRGVCFIYEDNGRLANAARITGNVSDEEQLGMLATYEGFRKLVYGIGVSVINDCGEPADFVFQMYGRRDTYGSGTVVRQHVSCDGVEYLIPMSEIDWTGDDDRPGQIRFEFARPGFLSTVNVCLYLNDGYTAPPFEGLAPVDTASAAYQSMIDRSVISMGNGARLKRAIDKARRGEMVTISAIGGSITQGAGATPINTECYARKFFEKFTAAYSPNGYTQYIKAGVGGTPSELGILRYERDVLQNGRIEPDIVIIEFAVNDAGDETGGDCFEGLVRKALNGPGHPAVILLFSVFADDTNLEERLVPIGRHYDLPMVSIKAAVTAQFYLTPETGRVIGKNRFYYDVYHPANLGHTIMADSLMRLMQLTADKASDADARGESDGTAMLPDELPDYENLAPLRTAEFECIRLIDRCDNPCRAVIEPGGFNAVDTEIQRVEMNMDAGTTPQFPNNWMYKGTGGEAFSCTLKARLLMIITKDSAGPADGRADIYVDGRLIKTVDPHEIGWIHCNAQIILREQEAAQHRIEVRMHPGDEDRHFTILGLGYAD